jgi:hypothetical protein
MDLIGGGAYKSDLRAKTYNFKMQIKKNDTFVSVNGLLCEPIPMSKGKF